MHLHTEAMQKLATLKVKREYMETQDKYVFAKDTLVTYLDDDAAPYISDSMVNVFEEILDAK